MGGLSGSNIADAAMESKMMVPEMTKKGFSLEFSSVVTAASSMITPLIPPGIAMILYGCIANVSIGKLFISGFGVGGLLCVSMMILVGVISKKRGYGLLTTEKLTWSKFWTALKPAILPLLLSKIVAEADRDIDVHEIFLRAIQYGKENNPDDGVTFIQNNKDILNTQKA